MRESTAQKLINLATAALGAAVALIAYSQGNMELAIAGGIAFGTAIKQPHTMLPRRKLPPGEPPATEVK